MPSILPSMRAWADANLPKPPAPSPREKPPKLPVVYTDATESDKRAIAALSPGKVNYCVGSSHKRFARDMQGAEKLTEAQRANVWRMVWRYRRQIGDAELVKEAESRGKEP